MVLSVNVLVEALTCMRYLDFHHQKVTILIDLILCIYLYQVVTFSILSFNIIIVVMYNVVRKPLMIKENRFVINVPGG